MKNSDIVNMEIKIGSQEVMLDVPFNEQNFVRDIESEIGNLYKSLRKKFPRKDERELLAMIVYQYASSYGYLVNRHKKAMEIARECEKKLEDIEI